MKLVTLGEGDIALELLPEVGARLHRLRVGGHDLLRTPADPDAHLRDPVFWGSYVMAPWCNRIEAAVRVPVGGRVVELPADFPDGTAIHGQVVARPWRQDGPGSFVVAGGGEGWPWEYEVRQRIAIDGQDRRLRLDYSLANRSEIPMPAGIGIHPWFLRPLRIAIRADRVYTANTAPEPAPVLVAGSFDLRRQRDVPDDLDACWADVGEPAVELAWPAIGLSATLRARVSVAGGGAAGAGSVRVAASPPPLHIVMASPAPLEAVGVEPQTHAPQGLRRLLDGLPGGLVMLGRGETLELDVELAFAALGQVPRSSSRVTSR